MKLSKEVKIGLFVVLILAATFTVINFLRGNDFLKGSTEIYSEYENVEGLTPAGPVYIKGFKAGSIVGVKYNQEKGDFLVKLNIKSDFKIPEDSRTEIYSSDILGGRAIRISLGESDKPVRSGDTLQGSVQPDMFSSILTSVTPLKEQLETLVTSLNKTVDGINDILDDDLRSDVKSIVAKIEKSAVNVEYITQKVKVRSPELTEIISNLNSLTQQLDASAVTLNKSLDDVSVITAEVREAQLKETITNLKNLIAKIQDPNGSLGKMMTTDSLHHSINSLAVDLDSLVKKIEKEPKKYMKISVF